MEIESVTNSESEVTEEMTFSKDELMDGKTKIPLGAVFPFLFTYVSQNLESQLGVSSRLDQNMLFLQQMVVRDRVNQNGEYQCLQPLLVDTPSGKPDKHATVVSLQKFDHKILPDGQRDQCDCYALYYLHPSEKVDQIDLQGLFELFTSKMSPHLDNSYNFSHILKCVNQCIQSNHFHFSILEKNKENNWIFLYSGKSLFIYRLPTIAPQPHIEKQTLCRWISVDIPIYERHLANGWYLPFTDIEIESIKHDQHASIPVDVADDK